jgi:hypothetical protein
MSDDFKKTGPKQAKGQVGMNALNNESLANDS